MATYTIVVIAPPGMSLDATIEKLSDGKYWNPVAIAFQAAPAYADKKIALVEGSAENAGGYIATVTGLANAGPIRVRVHDTDEANVTVVTEDVYIRDGGPAEHNRLADHVLRRGMAAARASDAGDTPSMRSPLGMLSRQCNKWEVVGGNLLVYAEDDTTLLLTIPLTSIPGADPITAMDPPA